MMDIGQTLSIYERMTASKLARGCLSHCLGARHATSCFCVQEAADSATDPRAFLKGMIPTIVTHLAPMRRRNMED